MLDEEHSFLFVQKNEVKMNADIQTRLVATFLANAQYMWGRAHRVQQKPPSNECSTAHSKETSTEVKNRNQSVVSAVDPSLVSYDSPQGNHDKTHPNFHFSEALTNIIMTCCRLHLASVTTQHVKLGCNANRIKICNANRIKIRNEISSLLYLAWFS